MNAFYERAMSGQVIVDIGQLKGADIRLLNAAIRRGKLARWRGRWFPVAGASYGLGPLKMCYGLPQVKEALS